jgi:hypothetical protein
MKKPPHLILIFFWVLTAYVGVSWWAFQFRHPPFNDSAFYTHFLDVVFWR